MRKRLILAFLVIAAYVPAAFGQMAVSADIYPWITDQAGVSVDYPVSNRVSVSGSGFWYYGHSWLSTAFSGSFGVRIYPFNGEDLGYRGFPKDLRDLGHFAAPYIRLDLEPAYISVDENYNIDPVVLLDASIGLGLRVFPARWGYAVFRPKKPIRIPVIDDLFMDFSLRYAYGVSRLLLSMSNAQESVVDKVLDPVRIQLSIGYCFGF